MVHIQMASLEVICVGCIIRTDLFTLCSALLLFLGSCGYIQEHMQVGDANKDHARWERPEDMEAKDCVQGREELSNPCDRLLGLIFLGD